MCELFKDLQKQTGLNNRELAEKLGKHITTIGNYRSGKITKETEYAMNYLVIVADIERDDDEWPEMLREQAG